MLDGNIKYRDDGIPELSRIIPENIDEDHEIERLIRQYSYDHAVEPDEEQIERLMEEISIRKKETIDHSNLRLGIEHKKIWDLGERLDSLFDDYRMTRYAPLISFLSHLTDLSGKTIVEVGSGILGLYALSYLSSFGATATAIDKNPKNQEDVKKLGISFKQSRWESISEKFEKNSVDIIYVVYMHDFPEIGGIFETRKEGDHDKWVRKCRVNINRFEKHVASEMHKILKPNGLFIIKNIDPFVHGAEYTIQLYENYTRQGFIHYRLDLPVHGKHLDIMQKKL